MKQPAWPQRPAPQIFRFTCCPQLEPAKAQPRGSGSSLQSDLCVFMISLSFFSLSLAHMPPVSNDEKEQKMCSPAMRETLNLSTQIISLEKL